LTALVVNESPDDIQIIKRAKKSLVKGFKLTSSNDINKAVMLANYLLALDKYKESAELLDSFIYQVNYEPDKEDIWGSNGQGVILRAYIAAIQNDRKTQGSLIKIIGDNDIMSDRCGRYVFFLEDLEEHNSNMEYAMAETQKYKCEVIGQEGLKFLYYYEMLPFYKDDAPSNLEQDLKLVIEKCYSSLKDALINK